MLGTESEEPLEQAGPRLCPREKAGERSERVDKGVGLIEYLIMGDEEKHDIDNRLLRWPRMYCAGNDTRWEEPFNSRPRDQPYLHGSDDVFHFSNVFTKY